MNRSDPLDNPEKFPRTYDVYGYVGDGVLSNSDFGLGSNVLPNVIYNNEPTLTLNVTAFINSLIANGDNFAGFSIRQQEAIAPPSDAEFGTGSGAYPVLQILSVPPNQSADCSNAAIADQSADATCSASISGADVTGVTDPDSDPLTITVSPTSLVLGANTVTVTADDGNGGMCSTDITVNVVDDTPPTLTAISSPIELWGSSAINRGAAGSPVVPPKFGQFRRSMTTKVPFLA